MKIKRKKDSDSEKEQSSTHRSDFWDVLSKPTPTTLMVSRKNNKQGVSWEVCEPCFVDSDGFKAPPIINGYCPSCGVRHRKGADDEEDSPGKKGSHLRGMRSFINPDLHHRYS